MLHSPCGHLLQGLLKPTHPQPVIGFARHHSIHLAQLLYTRRATQLHGDLELKDQALHDLADGLEAFAGSFEEREGQANEGRAEGQGARDIQPVAHTTCGDQG